MSEITLGVDLKRYPTLVRFSRSDAVIRFLIGPAGSLKTSWCFNELLRRACLQEPDAQGIRRTRWVVIRNTFEVLKRATMASCRMNIPEPLLKYTEGNMPRAEGTFALADGTLVEMRIDFLAVDSVDVLGKLLGYDFTGAILDEISELDEEIILAATRRAGRYPPLRFAAPTWYGAFGATNGPLKSHWLYKWYKGGDEDFKKNKTTMERETGRPFFELFQQPAALIRPDDKNGEWRPNPLAENVHNLPGGYAYYYNMLMADDQKIAAYVEGKFANLVTGELVFPEFSRDVHVIEAKKLPPLDGEPLLMGADFGRTPVCLVAAETIDGTIVILEEVTGTNTSVDVLYDDKVLPLLARKYRSSMVAEAWGDPAGNTGGQATEASPFSIINDKGIPIIAPSYNNQLGQRIEAVKYFLTRTSNRGRAKLLISDNCPLLIAALAENYIYESSGRDGTLKDVPTKSHVDWVSDLVDALEYLCLGVRLRGAKRNKVSRQFSSKRKGVVV